MFDIKTAMNNWQNDLILNQSMHTANIDELVSHLTECIDELKQKGLSEEESFWIVKHRIGDVQALGIEFSKINKAFIWRKRLAWLLSGYFIFATIPDILRLINIPYFKYISSRDPATSFSSYIPYTLFLIVFLFAGGVLFLLAGDNKMTKKIKIHNPYIIFRLKESYNYFFIFPAIYLMTIFGNLFAEVSLMRHSSSTSFYSIQNSQALFQILLNAFLVIFLIIISIALVKNKNTRAVY